MSNDKKLSAYDVLDSFFDEGSFCETDAYLKNTDGPGAVTGYGTVDGVAVYAFAQDADAAGGAMNTAQAKKITKLYSLALSTGAPIVGFYDSIGGKLGEGYDLLSAYGDILRKSAKLSGVVPMISVVLGNCLGASALCACAADFVIMTKDAKLTVSTMGEDADAQANIKSGTAQFAVDSAEDAVAKAKALLSYIPANNLEPAPAFEPVGAYEAPDKLPKFIADADSLLCVGEGFAEKCVCTAFGRVNGMTAGFVVTKGGKVCSNGCKKIYRFVRFCDAYSIPVITIADADGFSSLKDASGVIAAYTEATTAKIAVIKGKAVGAVYIALAGSSSGSDAVFALADAVVSPVEPIAAAYIMDEKIGDLPVADQADAADKFVKANLTALKAAESGYVDDIVDTDTVRGKITAALEILSSKRVSSIPKKHTTLL